MSLDHQSASDGELVALSLAGRKPAFAEIMRRHRAAVFRLIRSHIGDADEALDLTQETFVAAWRALRRYDPARSLLTWLCAIAINKCRDWGRKRAVRRFFSFAAPLEDARHVSEEQPELDTAAADRQELARVTDAIANLPAPLKEALILRTIEGLSQAETADILGVSAKTVETRLYRARAKLRDMLATSE